MRAGPTFLFARNELRRRWFSLLGLTLLIAFAGAFVLTTATGARRVATAWHRFGEATRAPNLVAIVPVDQLETTASELRTQPGVDGVSALAWLPIRPKELDDRREGGFAAMSTGFGSDVFRALVLDGRLADQSRADEFTINPALSRMTGLRVGDHTTLVSDMPGVELDATVVGITKSPLDTGANGGGPGILYTFALAQRFLEPVRAASGEAFQPALMARINANQEAIVAQLSEQFPGRTVAAGAVFGSEAKTALAVEQRAYWILAAVAGLAAVLALGQILVRSLRVVGGDVEALSALGCSTGQRMIMLITAPMLALTVGVVTAFGCAYLASTLVPTGLASRIDPEPGIWVEMRFAIAVDVALAVALIATLLVTAARVASRRAEATVIAPPSRLTSLSHTAPSLLGLRAALGGPDTATRRSARGATVIVVAAVASVIAVPVWTASLDNLRDTPRAHGWDFDAVIEEVSAPADELATIDALATKLDASATTSAIERIDIATVTAGGGNEIELMILQPRQRSLHPTLRHGRAPAGPDEVAISTQGMKSLHAEIGERIKIETPTGSHELTVVGEAIFPQLHNADWGGAASVTEAAVEPLGLAVTATMLLVDVASGRSLEDVRAVIGPDTLVRTPSPPPIVDNLREAIPVVRVLAIFIALLGAATLTHTLLTASHRRRRDHGTARAMGLTGRQLTTAFGWHGGTIALVAIAAGLPLGALVGAIAWRLSVRNLGVLDSLHIAPVITVNIAATTAVVAVLGAFAIAINARRAPLAASLRTE
ncbi:MAG: FtsX-like permease family protein [Acidimicrobiales bacterium]